MASTMQLLHICCRSVYKEGRETKLNYECESQFRLVNCYVIGIRGPAPNRFTAVDTIAGITNRLALSNSSN